MQENILEILKSPIRDKNSFIYWTLTRYNFFEKQIFDDSFMFEQFNKWINRYRKEGVTFGWLEKINDEKEICDFILKSTEEKPTHLQEKPLSDQELIAYERSKYKQHYEDMLTQRNELFCRCKELENKPSHEDEKKRTIINIWSFKIKKSPDRKQVEGKK